MTLRNPQNESRVFSVKLGATIKDALDGRPNRWLASRLQVDGATVGRIIKGQTPLTVDRIIEIEDALGLGHGTLIRRAEGVGINELDEIRADVAELRVSLEAIGEAVGRLLEERGLPPGPRPPQAR